MGAIFHHPIGYAFGLHGEYFNSTDIDASTTCWLNAGAILGWLPGPGSVVGAIRIWANAKEIISLHRRHHGFQGQDINTIQFNAALIGRGVVELFSLGFFFFPIDIIFTLGRAFTTNPAL